MKITDLSILCKWKTLKNRQCIKYLFAPLYIVCNDFIVLTHILQESNKTHLQSTRIQVVYVRLAYERVCSFTA